VDAYIIPNPVPTPEEMAEVLGISPDRVEAVRRIMSAPAQPKRVRSAGKARQAKKSRRTIDKN
jgi:hypothetical protein